MGLGYHTFHVCTMRMNLLDEAGMVDMHKCCHKELAVKPVHQTTMTWDRVTKVLQHNEVQDTFL